MSRDRAIIESFIAKWRDDDSGEPESEEALAAIEEALGTVLPGPYRYLMKTYGGVSTQRLMAAVAIGGYDLPDLLWLFGAEEVLSETREKAELLADGFVCFGTRMLGDFFFFDAQECRAAQGGDAPVWIYSHDGEEAFQHTAGFLDFLEQYLSVEPEEG